MRLSVCVCMLICGVQDSWTFLLIFSMLSRAFCVCLFVLHEILLRGWAFERPERFITDIEFERFCENISTSHITFSRACNKFNWIFIHCAWLLAVRLDFNHDFFSFDIMPHSMPYLSTHLCLLCVCIFTWIRFMCVFLRVSRLECFRILHCRIRFLITSTEMNNRRHNKSSLETYK